MIFLTVLALVLLSACSGGPDPGLPPIADHADRAAVVAAYQGTLRLDGDPARGKRYFEDACAKCHTPRKDGARVGPDLADKAHKPTDELLEAILNPSVEIDEEYRNYIVTTIDGQTTDGLLVENSPESVTLRDSESDVVILRGNLLQLRPSAVSLMPEDVERGLGLQAIADLLAYLKSADASAQLRIE